MPLWQVFSHPQTFTSEQRDKLAEAITQHYVVHSGLPAFYVNVLFIDLDEQHTYVGGQRKSNFVRITVEQIARQMPPSDTAEGKLYRETWMEKIRVTLAPHLADRGDLDWELSIHESPRDLWRVQGIDPPPAKSEAEKLWRINNRPTPWQETK